MILQHSIEILFLKIERQKGEPIWVSDRLAKEKRKEEDGSAAQVQLDELIKEGESDSLEFKS